MSDIIFSMDVFRSAGIAAELAGGIGARVSESLISDDIKKIL
jgi:hypothetical protein